MTPALYDLLDRTSRTFALTIPMLDEPMRSEVAVAYLCFRIADSLEDETAWDQRERTKVLTVFAGALDDEAELRKFQACVAQQPPLAESACHELLVQTDAVLAELHAADPISRKCIRHHVRKTALGMAASVSEHQAHGALRLPDLAALRHYCYLVAGIVGEMLTELFAHHEPTVREKLGELSRLAPAFGEGLQLVNMLKDADADARAERFFLPPSVPAAERFALARAGMASAKAYVRVLHRAGATRGSLAFTALPVLLAEATLEIVEQRGAGSKLSRAQVAELLSALDGALATGRLPF